MCGAGWVESRLQGALGFFLLVWIDENEMKGFFLSLSVLLSFSFSVSLLSLSFYLFISLFLSFVSPLYILFQCKSCDTFYGMPLLLVQLL